jgi:hypothetical protein
MKAMTHKTTKTACFSSFFSVWSGGVDDEERERQRETHTLLHTLIILVVVRRRGYTLL